MSRNPLAWERWRRIVVRQQVSGLSVAEFCRRHALAAGPLYAWKLRLRREADGASGFVAVHAGVEPPGPSPQVGPDRAIELHLDGHWRLVVRPGVDLPTLRQVLAVLEDRR